MRPAVIEQRSSYRPGGSRRGRAGAATLALAITALVLWMLLRMGMLPPGLTRAVTPLTMELLPAPGVIAGDRPQGSFPKKNRKPLEQNRLIRPAATPHPAPPTAEPVWNVIPLTSREMTSADISRMPSNPIARPTPLTPPSVETSRHDDSIVAGTSPTGESYYDAQLVRSPTNAELAPYWPLNHRSGWGEVTCRMTPSLQVEDCQEGDEAPPGSGFARAVRQSAWQWRLRPPRLGGKPLARALVRIHIDFNTLVAP